MANFIHLAVASKPTTTSLSSPFQDKISSYVFDFFKRHKDLLLLSTFISGLSSTITFTILYATCSLSLYNLTMLTLTVFIVSYIYLFATCLSDKQPLSPPTEKSSTTIPQLLEEAIEKNDIHRLKKICQFLITHPRFENLNRQFALRMYLKDLILNKENPLVTRAMYLRPDLAYPTDHHRAIAHIIRSFVDCRRFQASDGTVVSLPTIPLTNGCIIKKLKKDPHPGMRSLALQQENILPHHFKEAVDIAFREYTHLFDGIDFTFFQSTPS